MNESSSFWFMRALGIVSLACVILFLVFFIAPLLIGPNLALDQTNQTLRLVDLVKMFIGWSALPAFLGLISLFGKRVASANQGVLIAIMILGGILSLLSYFILSSAHLDCGSSCEGSIPDYGQISANSAALFLSWTLLPFLVFRSNRRKGF